MSSTLGSKRKTGWNRRASAASFSTCFLYSSSVVAPMQCNSPRASAGLSKIGSIHRAVGLAGADQRVHFVDEENDAAVGGYDLLKHGLEPLFEFAAIFGAGNHGAEIEREQPLVLKALRHVAIDDAQRETFDDCGLADAGLADQHRVVLGPAR